MPQERNSRISRRAFVRKSGLIGGASLLAAGAGVNPALAAAPVTQDDAPPDPERNVDIAIVGGGMSGLYCAWRLKESDPSLDIVVFEADDHLGGRLLSVQPPGIDDMVAELGGMRILPSVQPLIANLIEALNAELDADKQIELYDFPVDQPQNIAFLRDTHLRLSDFTEDPEKVPFNLTYLEEGQSGGGIIVHAVEQIVPGITDPDLDADERYEMLKVAEFDGVPLYQQGFWNVLARIVSDEAYKYAVDTIGYNIAVSNFNAVDGILGFLADFGIDPVYKGFKKGFQQVPLAMADLFTAVGGEIHLGSRVDGFDAVDDGFHLQLGDKVIGAGALILGMPRRALELLAPTSPPLQEFPDLIASVTPQPLFKIFATYDTPWWRNAGYTPEGGDYLPVESGRSVTDLPIQQTYYWAKDDGTAATDGPSMLMASYDDGSHISFWDGLRPPRGHAWRSGLLVATPDDSFEGACDPSENPDWCRYAAPRRMVAEVARQVAALHDLSYVPDIQDVAYRDWGDDPYGGAVNFWNIGVKSWEIIEQIVQPLEGMPLFICGEAYSNGQGWVEGALQTADKVLARFDLAPLS